MNCHSFQIILQANYTGSAEGTFSLDDVHIIRDRSCGDLVPPTTPAPVTTTTTAAASDMDCTFEQGDTEKLKFGIFLNTYFCSLCIPLAMIQIQYIKMKLYLE